MRDGASLYVRTLGRGEPVLMLPGLGMLSRQWLPFVLPHAMQFRFYMPDFRGHGRSLKAPLKPGDVFQSHAEDVQDVIAHFGLRDFAIVGLSLGATTAMHMQRETSFEGVRKYLHIDQSPNVLNDDTWRCGLAGEKQGDLIRHIRRALAILDQHPNASFFHQLPRPVRARVAREVAGALAIMGTPDQAVMFLQRALPILPGAALRRFPLMRLADMRAYLTGYSGGGHDYRPTLHLGDADVTLMSGMNSPLYPFAGQELVARANGGRVVRFERSGHVPLKDEPRKFMREFARFLRS